MTAGAGIEIEKQLGLWERRVKGLKRMLLGWDQAKPPEPPVSVFVDVLNVTTVAVKVYETTEGPLGTKFKGNATATTVNQIHTYIARIVRLNEQGW